MPDGNWVTTRRSPTHGVNIFDGATGAEIDTWDLVGFSGVPTDVGVFWDGTLAIVDNGGKIWRFDTRGNLISTWTVTGNPFGVLVDDQDEVWTCDASSGVLWHTDDKGNKINEFSVGNSAGDVTMADDGSLFVTRRDSGEVAHYAQDGTFLGAFMATNQSGTDAIAMGADQSLWISGEFETQLFNWGFRVPCA